MHRLVAGADFKPDGWAFAPDTLLIEALTYDLITHQLFVHTAA